MDKIKRWLYANILSAPIFWSSLSFMLVTKAKELGIAENSPYMSLLQLVLGALTATFLGSAIKENTTLTKETKQVAVNTIGMAQEAKIAAEKVADNLASNGNGKP